MEIGKGTQSFSITGRTKEEEEELLKTESPLDQEVQNPLAELEAGELQAPPEQQEVPTQQPTEPQEIPQDELEFEKEPEEEDDLSFREAAADVFAAPVRGLAGAAEGLIGLVDYIAPEDWITDWYVREEDSDYRSKTMVGGFIEGATQFAVGFGPLAFLGVASKAGKALKIAKLGDKAGKAVANVVSTTAKGGRSLDRSTMKTIVKMKKATKAAVRNASDGALADFLVFKGNENRISNLLKEHAGLEGNAFVEWMAYDPDKNEDELEGRFKNAIEGLLIGELAGAAVFGAKKGIEAIPEGPAAVNALKKVFGVFKDKNKRVGEGADEFEAMQKANDNPENKITPNEAKALIEVNQRIKDHNRIKEEERVTGNRQKNRDERNEEIEEELDEEQLELDLEEELEEIDTTKSTEEADDKWLRRNAGINPVHMSSEGKKEAIKEILAESKKGGREVMLRKFGQKLLRTISKAGIGDEANPISYLSGLRAIKEAPEMRTLLREVSQQVLRKQFADEFDAKSAASIYEETEQLISKGIEAAGGKEKGVNVEALRNRPEDLKIARIEAEVLWTALEKTGAQMQENYVNAQRIIEKGETLIDVELEGLGKVTLDEERAMTELDNSLEAFSLLQEMWSDFGTQLSLGLRDRQSLYKTGAIGRDIQGQNRSIRIALDKSSTLEAKLMRRDRRRGRSNKKFLKDYGKLFKKNKLDASAGVKSIMDRLNSNASSLHSISKYNLVKKKGLAVAQEWYINAILSSPTSWIANLLGGGLVLPLRQIETVVGAGLQGDFDVAKAHLRVFFDLHSFKESLKLAWRSGYEDEARSVRGYASFRDDRILAEEGEIYMNNPEGSTLKAAVNYVGKGVRFPTRIMMAGDEFFKQMSFRARTKTSLALEGYKRGLNKNPGKLAEFVEKGFSELITKQGRFRNEANVRKEAHMELNRLRDTTDTVIADQGAFIEEYMNKHFFSNKLEKEDGIIHGVLDQESRKELVEAGTDWALVNTFTNKVENTFFKKTGELATASPWMTFVIPFVRTPSNILLFALGRVTPLGAGKEVMKRRAAVKEMQSKSFDELNLDFEEGEEGFAAARKQAEEFLSLIEGESRIKSAEAVGRLATGVMSMGTMLMAVETIRDRITGAEPEEPGQKAIWRNTGKMAYSIEFGGKWYSYQRLDPFATILGIMADFVHLHDEAKAKAELDSDYNVSQEYEEKLPYYKTLLGIVATTMARNVSNKSYIENMGELLDILERPTETVPSIGANVLSSFVPNTINWSQNVYEEEPALLEARGLFDKIKKKLPEKLRTGDPLMPRRNFLGEVLRKDSSSTGSLAKSINPIFASEASNDIVDLELAQHGVGRVVPSHITKKINGRKIDLRNVRNSKGQTAFDRFLQLSEENTAGLAGRNMRQELRRLIESNSYNNLPELTDLNRDRNHPRAKAVSKVLNSYRQRAFNQMVREFREFF